jgi:hypothetical protein
MPLLRTHRALLAAGLLTLSVAAGCSSSGTGVPDKRAQCESFAAMVNAAKIGQSIGKEKEQLEAEATSAVELDQNIGKLQITDVELKKLVDEYRKNVVAYATVMQKGAEALEGDLDGLVKIVKEAAAIAEKNAAVTQQISTYCKAP